MRPTLATTGQESKNFKKRSQREEEGTIKQRAIHDSHCDCTTPTTGHSGATNGIENDMETVSVDVTQSRRKLRKLNEVANQPTDHPNMVEVKSEGEASERTTTSGQVHHREAARVSMTPTNITAVGLIKPFMPHGILRLPQSVASALAADFLKKREIRDLGVSCRWMLDSLSGCIIRESIFLRSVVQRWERQCAAMSSTQVDDGTRKLRELFGRIPNLFLGRFQNLRFVLSDSDCITVADMNYLAHMNQLVDARKLILGFYSNHFSLSLIQKQVAAILPLTLPTNLRELLIESTKCTPPLSQFILPQSLKRINWYTTSDPGCSTSCARLNNFAQVRWPSGLKELLNVNEISLDGLPDGITTISLDYEMRHLTNLHLPCSVTNLDMKWLDVTGCYYHDLPFPSQLKRLAIKCEIAKNDFNLNEWRYLPRSCSNIRLTLDRYQLSDTGVESQIRITMPDFVRNLYIIYSHPRGSVSERSRLCLTHATSLTTLQTNKINNIDWPSLTTAGDGVVLSSLKLHWLGDDLLSSSTTLPSTLIQLDLIESIDLYDLDVLDSDQLWRHLFQSVPQLQRLKVACHCNSPKVRQWVTSWSRLLPNCLIEYSIQPTNITTYQPNQYSNESSGRLSSYMNGQLIQPIRQLTTEQAKEWTSERERYDAIPSED